MYVSTDLKIPRKSCFVFEYFNDMSFAADVLQLGIFSFFREKSQKKLLNKSQKNHETSSWNTMKIYVQTQMYSRLVLMTLSQGS